MITHGTAEPLRIDGRATGPTLLHIYNRDNTASVYLGDADVTTSNGFPLDKSGSMYFTLYPLEQLYLISSQNGHIVSWIRQEN